MLVRFTSSETGEILMFADVARTLLTTLGKACTARGVFPRNEMLSAAARLRRDLSANPESPPEEGEEPVVSLGRRAWPLIDMLERSAQGDAEASIVWQAPADF